MDEGARDDAAGGEPGGLAAQEADGFEPPKGPGDGVFAVARVAFRQRLDRDLRPFGDGKHVRGDADRQVVQVPVLRQRVGDDAELAVEAGSDVRNAPRGTPTADKL
ncbi:hypothetical protein [Streptomyces sp. SPB074]|uniref:hypothetical protein n=1 Tax=Streptomyces sp. (strain SPB074) TaxID=465543 RepID=UPI001F423255|nr:hypothetical protein [Streptomyces sp. SPB074]